ncbi:MAG: ComEC/Rec2 family competence protein [Cyanobacteria bacterium J06639_16]
MSPLGAVWICLAYGFGVVMASVSTHWPIVLAFPIVGYGVLLGCVVAALTVPRYWWQGPSRQIWIVMGCVGLLASGYYQWRLPVPNAQNISQFVVQTSKVCATPTVTGRVVTEPRLTRSQKGQFTLAVDTLRCWDDRAEITYDQSVRGRLYVTAPMLQVTGIRPGHQVTLTGNLYMPDPAQNDSDFDFKAYLAARDIFAGFQASNIDLPREEEAFQSGWGLWQLRRRIVKAHVKALKSPAGPMVSAMALGRRAVDLPYDIRDTFVQAGLAHTMAASGFHVSLILGVVLALTRSRLPRTQAIAGGITLLLYIGLTGIQPSVLRAALMGGGSLIGLVLDRRVKPLGCLLMAIVGLLVWNPKWITDIGFQLSAVATLGLIVTVPAIAKRLDWLPTNLATVIAVPLAAYLWTMPLQLYWFHTFSPHSILLNIISTPLVIGLSLGGVISGLAAMVWQPLGSALALPLYYPAHALLHLAEFTNRQPLSGLSTGQFSELQCLGIYGLFGLAWGWPWWQKRWWIVSGLVLSVIVVPWWFKVASLTQVTVLATTEDPVLVLQDQGKTLLINSGRASTATHTVLPFLRQAGINHLDWAIAPRLPRDYPDGWETIFNAAPVTTFYGQDDQDPLPALPKHYVSMPVGQSTQLEAGVVQRLGRDNPILRFTVKNQSWLLLTPLDASLQAYLAQAGATLQSQVLWWDGTPLVDALLNVVQPSVAVCFGHDLDLTVERQLRDRGVQLYWPTRDGALQWRPKAGFQLQQGNGDLDVTLSG